MNTKTTELIRAMNAYAYVGDWASARVCWALLIGWGART
jgi:hypothetical protein